MQREPNPYSKNPMLTVTGTMAISVPSVVAEDVMNGEADKVTSVDPAVNSRIDAVSEAVDLMDTRIDTVSEVLALKGASGSELIYSGITLGNALEKIGFSGDQYYEVISVAGNFNGNGTDLHYYALAAGAFASVDDPRCQFKVATSGPLYTTDGGDTWTAVVDNNYLPVYDYSGQDPVGLYTMDGAATTYIGNTQYNSRFLRFGPDYSNMVYGLQTSLAAIGVHGTPGKKSQYAGAVQMALVQGDTYYSEPHFIWWNDNKNAYYKWEPWKDSGSSSSSSGTTATTGDLIIPSRYSDDDSCAMYVRNTGSSIIIALYSKDSDFNGQIALSCGLASASNGYNTTMTVHSMGVLEFRQGTSKKIFDLTTGGSSSGSVSNGVNIDSSIKLTLDEVHYDGVQDSEDSMNSTELSYAITPRAADTNTVYPLATTGLKCPYDEKTAVCWNTTGNKYKLQFTEDGGNTWSDLGGGGVTNIVTSTSSEVSFIPCNGDFSKLVIDASTESIQLDAVDVRYDMSKANIGLQYGLKTSLASFNDDGVKLRLSHRTSGGTIMPVLQVRKGYDADWEDFTISGGSSGSSVTGEETVRYTNNQYPYLLLDLDSGRNLAFRDSNNVYIDSILADTITNPDTDCALRIGSRYYNNRLEYYNGSKWTTIIDEDGNLVGGSGSSSSDSSSTDFNLEATFTVDELGYYGVNNVADAYGTNASGTYCLYNVISIRDAHSGIVYPITTTGWACPVSGDTGVYWNKTEQGYRLQFTEDGGRTWTNLGGGSSNSSSGTSSGSNTSAGINVANYLQYDSSGVKALVAGWNNNPALNWSVESLDSGASWSSGVNVLMGNAIATYSRAYEHTSAYDINGKIIPVLADGKLSWAYWDQYSGTWMPASGGAGSTEALYCNFSVENTLYPDASHLLYVNTDTYSMRLYTDATSTASYLEYGLQTALAGFNEESNCRLRVHQISGKAVIQLSNNRGNTWETVTDDEQSVTIDAALSATSENPVQNKVVHAELAKKQDVLESGTTLKTINGISLLGGGDIQIGSDGSTSTTAEFVPVQYLGNTGTQYIDTGYVLQEDDVLEVDYEIPESALSVKIDKILIDARDDSYGVRVSTYSGTYKWYARFGHNESQTSAALTSSLKGSLTLSKGQFILNGSVVFDSLVFSAMPTGTLKLLAGVNYETGAISAPSYARISACKIKRNGETIRNFRPVQRTADGELGMRDAVTGEFLTNAGTGVFDYLPSDVVEAGTVVKKPTLTEEQKLALQALMDDYYNNRSTFFYEFTHNRNAFTSGGQCYDSAKGKFKQCCATFVQHIMMGRSVNDFVGKTGSTYSPNITKTAVSDFGYYFDFKYRKYLYGLTDTDENGNEVYYGYNQPNEDNFEGSYSYNSYYHPDSKNTNKQNFNGFCNANDMARELYEMGCEVPFAELDVGDIIFTLDNDLSDNSSMLNFHAWRNIYHVGMVYDVKQIDASSKEIYYIECTSYFDVDNRPIEKPFLSSSQMDLRFKAFKLTEDMAFCARMPIAFGYAPNVPSKITTSATPS